MRIFLVLSLLLISNFSLARQAVSGNRFELLSGIRNNSKSQLFWDKKFNKERYVYGKAPSKFLAENYDYIPHGSRVLDIGMGEGRNAVFLATKGYKVTGVEISPIAIRKAKLLAREFDVRIDPVLSSIEDYKVEKNSLDAIICFYFVDKAINEKFFEWLKPGGILIFEAFTKRQESISKDKEIDLGEVFEEGELLKIFPKMRTLKFEEPLHRKDFTTSIILQKPRESSSGLQN
ncbi:class I SAM-dependent methyltransferase [Halobacteriovorax sp. GB3]|uniref:class I SAM-dependent methyltransferase n=1 Tax=Halobacteriovorax sp. GB3 TaxID=2719615 RepID=UPI002362E50A|nr:class I SAM-dependent methyltransferase [Halobacteriovorax sp. GB3]MDD0852447.1 class I SAM-dependent methyltransferase [Halobacteriovorax sp. GB3]